MGLGLANPKAKPSPSPSPTPSLPHEALRAAVEHVGVLREQVHLPEAAHLVHLP